MLRSEFKISSVLWLIIPAIRNNQKISQTKVEHTSDLRSLLLWNAPLESLVFISPRMLSVCLSSALRPAVSGFRTGTSTADLKALDGSETTRATPASVPPRLGRARERGAPATPGWLATGRRYVPGLSFPLRFGPLSRTQMSRCWAFLLRFLLARAPRSVFCSPHH